MTASQLLSLIGGGAQAWALIWAWIALYHLWRARWPNQPIVPWAAHMWTAVRAWTITVWYRITRRSRTTSATVSVPAMVVTVRASGEVQVRADLRIEERVGILEERFRQMEEHHGRELQSVRETIEVRLTGVAKQIEEAQHISDQLEQREARFNLTGPAAVAIVGTVLQVWAVFA